MNCPNSNGQVSIRQAQPALPNPVTALWVTEHSYVFGLTHLARAANRAAGPRASVSVRAFTASDTMALPPQAEQCAADFPTLGAMLEGLEQGVLIATPPDVSRKARQALAAHVRAACLLRCGSLARRPEGRDVYERLSVFYLNWAARPVLGFCSHKADRPRCFMSNWFEADFTFEPCPLLSRWLRLPLDPLREYRTAEHAIMHCKASIFGDEHVFELVGKAYEQDLGDAAFNAAEAEFLGERQRYSSHADYVKSLGRRVSAFDEDLWQRLLLVLAVSVVSQKFLKRPELWSLDFGSENSFWPLEFDSEDPIQVSLLPYWRQRNPNLPNQIPVASRLGNNTVKDGSPESNSSHQELADLLKSTSDSILVEAADYDSQWGVLLKEGLPQVHDLREWRGWNVLGEALMITREHLLTEEPLWQQRFFSTSLSVSSIQDCRAQKVRSRAPR